MEQSDLTIKNVSAQLRVMKEAGLLMSRKDGKHVYYSVANGEVSRFWSTLQAFASYQFTELQAITAKLIDDSESMIGVNRKQLVSRAKAGDVVILDVRPSDEYDAGHLPYAVSIPLKELHAKLKTLPRNKEIVAYCRGPFCLLAVEAVRILRRKGFKSIRLEDGVQNWKLSGFTVEIST